MNTEIEKLMDSLETAWGIIANAYGGDWEKASPEWREAAERFRDNDWYPALKRNGYASRLSGSVAEQSTPATTPSEND